MVYFSTDYIFDGTKRTFRTQHMIRLTHFPHMGRVSLQVNMLAAASECRRTINSHKLVIWGYGGKLCSDRLSDVPRKADHSELVDDQTGSPTWAEHVGEVTLDLVSHQLSGTYHITDSGEGTWYESGSGGFIDLPVFILRD